MKFYPMIFFFVESFVIIFLFISVVLRRIQEEGKETILFFQEVLFKKVDVFISIFISIATCKCPPNVFMNWYSNPPYVSRAPGLQVSGFMPGLIADMISASCGKCDNRASQVLHYRSLSGENPMKRNEATVKKSVGSDYHISYPIFGSSSITRFMESHVFVLIVQSAGSAAIVKHEVDYSAKTLNAFKSILNIWPMYLIAICMTSLAGILVWITVIWRGYLFYCTYLA